MEKKRYNALDSEKIKVFALFASTVEEEGTTVHQNNLAKPVWEFGVRDWVGNRQQSMHGLLCPPLLHNAPLSYKPNVIVKAEVEVKEKMKWRETN